MPKRPPSASGHRGGPAKPRRRGEIFDTPDGFGDGILHAKKDKVDQPAAPRQSPPARQVHFPHPGGLPDDRPIDLDDYFDQLEGWLDLEGDAEAERLAARRSLRSLDEVERSGEAIVSLQWTDHKSGLGGRFLLDLNKPGGRPLPHSRLKVGSPVVMSLQDDDDDSGVSGVVSLRTATRLQIATERLPEQPVIAARGVGRHGRGGVKAFSTSGLFRVDLSPDETTRKRQLAAMEAACGAKGRAKRLREVLLTRREPTFEEPIDDDPPSFVTNLNPPQRQAVRFALSADDVAVIHGPPGTGKTTTLVEVIGRAVAAGDKVLACAASNSAVDNLLEKLTDAMPRVVRLGHPARVHHRLREFTLDSLVERDPAGKVLVDLRRELQKTLNWMDKADSRKERGKLQGEAGKLRGQIRGIERMIVQGIIDSADVVCTTATIDDDLLGDRQFELGVIDEACQLPEPAIWQAAARVRRLVLAGDHCQLPPTVLSDVAARAGMGCSTMQRLVNRHGERIYRRLTVQYRMNAEIMAFSNDAFYDGDLIADASVKSHRLSDLDNIEPCELTRTPIEMIDTAGAEMTEQLEPGGSSKMNPGEANIIVGLVRELTEAGVRGDQIAVIAPYAAQVRTLRNRLDLFGLEIDTVDGFQGREKEVVLISMTRSNPTGEIGFLGDQRRTNVAMTRARRKLIVVGDSSTIGRHPFYESMLNHFEQQNAYRSVFELQA